MIAEWIIGSLLILSSIGVITARSPVHSSLFFLATLLSLAVCYLELSAPFISAMQVLVYAGAILVIFMFVIILFQDAHEEIDKYPSLSSPFLLVGAIGAITFMMLFLGRKLQGLSLSREQLPEGYGTVETLGKALYIDFFFPFEAVVLVFLIALIGALYIGRKAV
jgi:NADH-quinone oxidoreductase subunit J